MVEIFIVFLGMLGGLGLPMGMPPGEEDVRMHQIAPDDALAYASWSGIREPVADANPTEKWLSIKEVAKFRRRLRAALFDFGTNTWMRRNEPEPAPLARKCCEMIFDAGIRNPTAVYLRQVNLDEAIVKVDVAALAAVRLKSELAPFRKSFQDWKAAIEKDAPMYQGHELVKLESVDVQAIRILDLANISVNDNDLFLALIDDLVFIATSTQEIELALKNLKTPAPKWLAEFRKDLAMEQVGSMSYLNLETAIKTFPDLWDPMFGGMRSTDLGMENDVRSMANVCGITKLGFTARSKLYLVPGAVGPLSALGSRPLNDDELGAISTDSAGGIAVRMNTPFVLKWVKQSLRDSVFEQELDNALKEREDFTREKIEDAFNKGIGDFAVFQSKTKFLDSRFDWRFDISIKEVMTFPGLINQLSESLTELIKEREYGTVDRVTVGNNLFYSYKGQQAWQAVNWSVIDDRMVMGHLTPEELAAPFPSAIEKRYSTQPPLKGLIEYGVQKKLGKPVGVLVLDLPKVMSEFRGFLDNIQNQDNEIVSGVDFLFSDIPKAKFWIDDMPPHLTTLYRVDDGIVFHQTQAVPGSNWVTTAGALATAFGLFEIR